ncbi:anion transporter [bacterium]|nr:anion transporter [bacterium]
MSLLQDRLFLACLVLAFTFGGVSLRRFPFLPLDRPAIAFLGAAATVVLGVLKLDEAFAAIKLDVIALLLGTMVTAGTLARAGFYGRVARSLGDLARAEPRKFLLGIVVSSGVLSALVVNDTVCVFFAPLVIQSARAAGRRPMPFLIALALAANTGSAGTLVGNPQNALIGIASNLGFARFAALAGPVALLGLILAYLAVSIFYRKELAAEPAPPTSPVDPSAPVPAPPYDAALARRGLMALALTTALLFSGVPLALSAVLGAAAAVVISRIPPRELWRTVDWPLLLFFAGLFIVTEGARSAGAIGRIEQGFRPLLGTGLPRQAVVMASVTAIASQVVSNVPFVMAARPWIPGLESPDAQWVLLALSSTFAGNLTLVGSIANLIVAEASTRDEPMGFLEHLKVGLPVALVQIALSVAAVIAYVSLGWL